MTTEHDVLGDLEAALKVTPSPGFEARVRARVGHESIGVPRWTWSVGVAVAATLVLAVMLVPERRERVVRVAMSWARTRNKTRRVGLSRLLTSTARYQPIRTSCARPAASLRSVLLSWSERAA